MMTPSELSKLKSLAEAVIATSSDYYHDVKVCDVDEVNDYLFATDPQVILSLIWQLEASQAKLQGAIEVIESIASLDHPEQSASSWWFERERSEVAEVVAHDTNIARQFLSTLEPNMGKK